MSIGHPVRRDREIIAGVGKRLFVRVAAGLNHQMRHRSWIVRRGNSCERERGRDALAGLHQASRSRTLFIGDVVECAALVVLAPTSPIAVFLEQSLYVR